MLKPIMAAGTALCSNILLYVTAYVPLIFMSAVLLCSNSPRVAIWISAIGAISTVLCIISISASFKQSIERAQISSISPNGNSAMSYMATYILPFIAGFPEDRAEWVAAGIYMLTTFVIFCRTQVKAINPTLFILGMRVSRVKLVERSESIDVIHYKRMIIGDELGIVNFGGIYAAKKMTK